VVVPEGEFIMNLADEHQEANWHDMPQQSIILYEYWIYEHGVSNKQFATFI